MFEFAPAKLNLYLHVTGRKPDGYHILDSLVCFAGVGDEVRLKSAAQFALHVEGPYAAGLADLPPEDNLVVKTVWSLAEATRQPLRFELTLVKNLPVASGIGGGSSDAAAALRLVARHWGIAPDESRVFQAAAKHGQDITVCLKLINNYMTAEGVLPAHGLPQAGIVLVNPNQALPTPAVFREFRDSGAPFTPVARLGAEPVDLKELIDALKQRANDLYAPASRLLPALAQVMQALEQQENCLLARMSGSGATCFGLFADQAQAETAGKRLKAAHPEWWVAGSFIPFLGDSL